ncbi:nucleotidyltransferase domain-containing protein [Colwellia sp. D2M02]|uniref:nucleotidyltransferase domain-containing protein n=1 Tax=Colwellia sp. D2M02 TaxID=2841562 RepID=UPI001C0969C5|nr:nucleotidyltransferase domain-containing protein [Colwellia sp. D2M02]MBU2893531.1 nucleotidyltransferase domain-containing protein [Colwellia sp. D2M02]
MNIDSKSLIAGLPALEARDIASKLANFYNGFSIKCYAEMFNINRPLAIKQIEAFETQGYIERIENHKSKPFWERTVKGCQLSMASAAKRVKRTTADKHFRDFLERVNEVNTNDKFLYQVSKVSLFGSYLTDAETVSDIDLFVWLERKPKFSQNFSMVREQRAIEMQSEGRNFKSYDELLSWPELDVRKYLKNRSRVISIQGNHFGAEQIDYKIIFEISDVS